ncbi:MAG: hypothetical protein ACQEQV_08835 [Fibrobacterota bacterium]
MGKIILFTLLLTFSLAADPALQLLLARRSIADGYFQWNEVRLAQGAEKARDAAVNEDVDAVFHYVLARYLQIHHARYAYDYHRDPGRADSLLNRMDRFLAVHGDSTPLSTTAKALCNTLRMDLHPLKKAVLIPRVRKDLQALPPLAPPRNILRALIHIHGPRGIQDYPQAQRILTTTFRSYYIKENRNDLWLWSAAAALKGILHKKEENEALSRQWLHRAFQINRRDAFARIGFIAD